MAIKTFKHKGLEKFFYSGVKSKLPASQINKIELILDRLDASIRPEDMNYPGSQFHSLHGKRKGFYSVHVTGNYVIVFRFDSGDAYDVEYLDYH